MSIFINIIIINIGLGVWFLLGSNPGRAPTCYILPGSWQCNKTRRPRSIQVNSKIYLCKERIHNKLTNKNNNNKKLVLERSQAQMIDGRDWWYRLEISYSQSNATPVKSTFKPLISVNPTQEQNKWIVNFSKKFQLSKEQCAVLLRGLSFIPTPKRIKTQKLKLLKDLQAYYCRVKLETFFKQITELITAENYPCTHTYIGVLEKKRKPH